MLTTHATIYAARKRIRDWFVTVPYTLRVYLFPRQPRWYSITVIVTTAVILTAMLAGVVLS